jgi:hypothetical protein
MTNLLEQAISCDDGDRLPSSSSKPLASNPTTW